MSTSGSLMIWLIHCHEAAVAAIAPAARPMMTAAQLDELLVDKIAEVRFAGQEETAQALEAEALFAVRQRRQALVTSLAASMQNYMALSLHFKLVGTTGGTGLVQPSWS